MALPSRDVKFTCPMGVVMNQESNKSDERLLTELPDAAECSVDLTELVRMGRAQRIKKGVASSEDPDIPVRTEVLRDWIADIAAQRSAHAGRRRVVRMREVGADHLVDEERG
jgi:hypothetical protein